MSRIMRALWCAVWLAGSMGCDAAQAGEPLVVARNGTTSAKILLAPDGTGSDEKAAAADLAKYIGLMTGATPAVLNTREAIDAALKTREPLFLIGTEALRVKPVLAARLAAVAKKDPVLRADAIVLLREGNRVFLAGTNDECHYYAIAELLRRWGCRWYMPTDFGECIPEKPTLELGPLDTAYAPPFEVRGYWIAWNGDNNGFEPFKRRNMMTHRRVAVPSGHILAKYTADLAPAGKTIFNIPVSEESTAAHIAKKVAPLYEKGETFSLGMEDGMYESDSESDRALRALQYDKYFLMPAMTDAFMTLYNHVARILREQYPESRSRIGFLAYSNITLPPVKVTKAEPALVAYLAPIDIDPIHHMDDPRAPARHEYRDMLYGWAKVMDGRVVIYDYDQSMLVWRDIPNPSIQMLARDFAHYRKAGILGVDTESRNAIATVFLNLHVRARLLWDPDTDVDALLEEFYPLFYGPAAAPMKAYWSAIFDAWKETIVTEHEHFVAPAIYTAPLLARLEQELLRAENAVKSLAAKKEPTPRERMFLTRMRFTRLGFDILRNYMAMVSAAATVGDYAAAVTFGEKGLAARDALTDMDGIFTTYRKIGEHGAAWWPGEVAQYRQIAKRLSDNGATVLAKLPLEWAFRRDPKDTGLKEGWGLAAPDLAYWSEHGESHTVETRKDYPVTQWEMVRTDLYLQAQGILHPDWQNFSGWGWYSTEVDLPELAAGKPVKLLFPGLFNEAWLYVNGREVAHRKNYKPMWWHNDYRFEWEADLTGALKPGKNRMTLRINNPHHFGGMFRRPLLYVPGEQADNATKAEKP